MAFLGGGMWVDEKGYVLRRDVRQHRDRPRCC